MKRSQGQNSWKQNWTNRVLSGVLAGAMLVSQFAGGLPVYAADTAADTSGSSAAQTSSSEPASAAAVDLTGALSCTGSLQQEDQTQGDSAVVWTIAIAPGTPVSLAGLRLKLTVAPSQLTLVKAEAADASGTANEITAAVAAAAGTDGTAALQYDFPAGAAAPQTVTVTMQIPDTLRQAGGEALSLTAAASLEQLDTTAAVTLPQTVTASVTAEQPQPTPAPSADADTSSSSAPTAPDASSSAAPAAGEDADSAQSGIAGLFAKLFAAPAPEADVTATVTNTAYNYSADAKITYTIDKAATVTIDGTTTDVAAGGSFEVPQGTASFTVTTAQQAKLTLDSAATGGCLLLSAASQTLTGETATAAFLSQMPLANVSLYKEWRDGASASKNIDGMALGLQFSTDGGASWTDLTADNMAALGYPSLPAVPARTTGQSNESTWKYDFTSVLAGKNAAGADVTYRLAETSVPDDYAASYLDENGVSTLCNTLKKPLTAAVKWLDAANSYQTRITPAAWISGLTITRSTILGDGTPVVASTDPNSEFYVTVKDNGDGSWTVSMPNALGYSSQNFPYTYSILQSDVPVAQGATVPAGSVYVPEYRNVDTHASNEGTLFDGGTATDKLDGETQFTATKQWMDDGTPATIAARPTAAITLYRYAKGRGSYTTASPVSLAGAVLSGVAVNNTAGKGETIPLTLPAEAGKMLPLFDEDGYQYVYFAKETLTGGTNAYAQVFDNSASGDYGESASGKTDKARYLFNGGTLNNTITGTVGLAASKQWIAAARQDVDAQVTMSVDQSDPGDGTGAATVNKGYATKVLQGFGAEVTTLTAEFSGLPKYNSYGLAYTYTVSETGVKTKTGTVYADAAEKTADGKQYIVTADGYRYLQKNSTDTDGKVTVQNVLVGNAQVIINKTFSNGLLADGATTLTYTIYRNGTAIGTKTVSYNKADHPEVPFVPDKLTLTSFADLDTNATAETGLLPRYDAAGAEYNYAVLETGIAPSGVYGHTDSTARGEATYADGDYAGEHYLTATASISNYKPGEGTSISVYKNWIDDGDKMYHSTVSFALQYNAGSEAQPSWVTVSAGSIPTSTNYSYLGVTGTAADNTTYAAHYKSWVEAGRPADAAGAFRVVETKLGDSAVVLHAAVDAAAHPEHETASVTVNGRSMNWSFVSTPNQNYDVSPEAACSVSYEGRSWDFALTNKRVGVEKIQLTKVWKDGGDENNTRPTSISFTVTASTAVFDGGTTKDFTASGTGDVWTLDTGWLTKYDDKGAVIRYEIAESDAAKTALADKNYTSSSRHVGYVVGAQHTADVDTYVFTNQLSGTVVPYMNKIWMDTGTAAQMSLRPDIYPVLIRGYTDAGNVTHYEKMGFTERDWNTNKITPSWWTCTFVPQTRYTDDGFEYTYYVGEEYTTANLNDYYCSGGYTNEPDDGGGFTEQQANLANTITLTVNGSAKTYAVARLDNASGHAGTLVNKPKAARTVSGSKLWVNLPKEFNRGNLPAVTFQLYRCSYDSYQKNGDKNAVAVTESLDTDGNLVSQPAGFFTTMASGANGFAFEGSFPKYDEYGKPYYYVVRETAPKNMDVVYTITNDPSTGLVVQNSYNSDQSFAVTFTKNWLTSNPADITAYAKKPAFTLTLVRYLTNADGSAIARTRESAFAAAGTNGNANAVSLTYDNNTADTIQWSELPYYAPNGRPYQYRVEETNVPNGWTVSDGGTVLTAAKLDSGATGYTVTVSGSYDGTTGTGAAALTNRYGDVLGSLQLAKAWASDSAYEISARPSSVSLTLKRTADGSTETVGSYELTALEGWKRSLTGLEIYAPSGSAYTYSVEEQPVPANYQVTYSSGVAAAPAGTNAPTLTATNTAQNTSLTIQKVWALSTANTDDAYGTTGTASRLLFEANLGGVPTEIVYHAAYSTDGGTTWKTLMQNGKAAFWTATAKENYGRKASSLPKQIWEDGSLKDVIYTAYEYSVKRGGTTYTRATDAPGAANFVTMQSSDAARSETTGGTTAAITNTIALRKITITKVWDDQQNRDGLRAPLTFTITRTGVNSETDTAKTTVVLKEANAVAGNADQWSATYYVPLYRNDSTTAMSSYTVEETSGVSAEYSGASGTDGAAWTAAAAGTKPAVALGAVETDTSAWFKNTKAFDTFALSAAKQWLYNGSAVSAAVLAEYKNYFPQTITYKLEYSTDNTNWKTADDALVAGIQAVKTAAVNANTGAVDAVSWESLPKAQLTGNVDTQKPYYYRVTEQSVAAPFAASYDKALTANKWTAGNTVTGTAATTNGTATVRTSNNLSLTSLAVTKSWTDADNLYNTRPDAVLYEIQYSADGAIWTDVPTAWLDSHTNPVSAAKAQSYGVTFAHLPQKTPDGTAYQYRALETGLVYGGSTVAPGADALYQSTTADNKAFVNTLGMSSFTFEKAWGTDPAGISGAVTGIVVRLQRTTKADPAESDWADVTYGSGSTEWQVDRNAQSGAIAKTWSDLPARDVSGTAYTYRAVEAALLVKNGGTAVRVNASGTALSGTVGGFTYAAVTTNDSTAHRTVVTNTPVTGSLKVAKTWNDDNDRDGIRPASLTAVLTAKSSLFSSLSLGTVSGTATLPAGTPAVWEHVWSNLPVSDAAGNPITYTVTESGSNGYTAAYAITGGSTAAGSGLAAPALLASAQQTAVTFTNTHTPAVMSVTASKIWKDDVAADRPASLSYTLQRSPDGSSWTDVETRTVAVSAANGSCTTVWSSLPVFLAGDSGTLLHYRVTEAAVNGYTSAWSSQNLTGSALAAANSGVNAKTATVTNTMIPSALTVHKTWTDSYQLNTAVSQVVYQLQRKTAAGTQWADYLAPQAAAKGEDYTWNGLPSCDNSGSALVYRARETGLVLADGTTVSASGDALAGTVGGYRYAAQTTGADGSFATAIANTAITGALAVTKTWDDDSNREALRPSKLDLSLSTTVDGSAVTLTGVAAGTVLNAGNDWADSTTWAAVPVMNAAGKTILYTLTEAATTGYTASYQITGGATGSGSTVSAPLQAAAGKTTTAAFTNKRALATVAVTANKVWADNNAYGDRPASVEFTLYANYSDADGQAVKEKVTADNAGHAVTNPAVLTTANRNAADANRWEISWSGLPKYKAGLEGSEITYTVEETPLTGYDASTSGTVITNTMQETQLTVNKTWGADAVEEAQDVTDITYALQRLAEGGTVWSTVATQTVLRAQDGSFSYTWESLPQYSAVGAAYAYRAVELSLTKGGTALQLTATDGSGEKGYLGSFFTASASTAGSGNDGYLTEVTNDRTQADFSFAKAGTCDEVDLTRTTPLAGAVFGLYAEETCTGDPLMIAQSDENGSVLFAKVPCGTYYLCEISAPANYKVSTEVYPLTVNEKGEAASAKLAAAVPANTVVDEAVRGSFTMVKTDETNPALKVPGTTYSLYKKTAAGEVWVADGVTGADGSVTFENLLIGTDYLLRETKATAGYQRSANAVGISFVLAEEGGKALVQLTDNGGGTLQESTDGSFTWIEPPTRVEIRKENPEGALLSGAKLRVVDAGGTVVDSWTSDGTAHLLTGVLTAGASYTLEETAAPSGYDLAAPVTFTVESKAEAPRTLYLQTVRMTDARTPAAPLTGDNSRIAAPLTLQLLGGTGLILLFALTRRKKKKPQGQSARS